MRLELVLVLVVAGFCADAAVKYDGYSVYRVLPKNLYQLEALRNLDGYDFWSDATHLHRYADIMVSPEQKIQFQRILNTLQLESSVMIDDVQHLINQEQNYTVARSESFNWYNYQNLDQINDWLLSLEKQHPSVVTRVKGGQSYENRVIYGVRVSFRPGNRAVFLEGGIHAREWISPATVTFILNELLTSTDPNVRAIAESRDWYVFPVFNPDGYEYTHQTNRMWRKTRTPYGDEFGADPNRNWDYHWKEGGSSSFPSLDTYAGPYAFSETETKTLSEYITNIAPSLDAYLAFHSYGQMLLIPFGHRGLEKPPNNPELHEMGNKAIKKLSESYGTSYTVSNIPDAVGIASGGSVDWVAGVHHIRMVYAFELRDKGRYGFILPANQIIPTAEETLQAVISLIDDLNNN